jgi:hypothetical protein
MAQWRFVLATHWNANIGELVNATDRNVYIPLNALETLSFKVRLDHPLAASMDLTAANRVKAYRDGVLMASTNIFSVEETGDATGNWLSVNCVSNAYFAFMGRIPARGPRAGTVDAGVLVYGIIGLENVTSIKDEGSAVLTTGSTVTNYVPGEKNVLEVLQELSAGGFYFDWRIQPLDPTPTSSSGNPPGCCRLLMASSIGSTKSNAVFEWGSSTRANMVSYKKVTSRETQANEIYAVVTNPYSQWLISSGTNATENVKWDIMDDTVEASALKDTDAQALINQHYNARHLPRTVVEFVPAVNQANIPQYGTDYSIGDRVRGRAAYRGTTRFDGLFRVWAVNFAIDDNGTELVTPTLADPT